MIDGNLSDLPLPIERRWQFHLVTYGYADWIVAIHDGDRQAKRRIHRTLLPSDTHDCAGGLTDESTDGDTYPLVVTVW